MSASTPIQTSLNNLSAWASFDTLLQRLDITTEPDFWDGLVTLIHYQEYFLESQYNDLAEGCVPSEAQQGPNKIQTPNPPNQPDPECLCANSPFYAWEIHGIECTEYRLLYWYHPDYGTSRATVARSKARLATVMRDLGHNEFITDNSGLPYQYFHFSAFGETLVEDNAHYGQFSSPYRFNAKELDQKTGNYYYGARYYNPTWSVWLSVDAMASKGLNITPYAFSHNNPIMLVDPDGNWPYLVTIRSFHPAKTFGSGGLGLGRGFGGDDRGFELSPLAPSRITHYTTVDPQSRTVDYNPKGGTFSDDSHHPYWGTDQAVPAGYIGEVRKTENGVSYQTGYTGTIPLIPAPYIDVDAQLSFEQVGNILIITGEMLGDDFPNTEASITDGAGQKLFIGVDVRAPGYDKNPTILAGGADKKIMDINMKVLTNPVNGNFEAVWQNGEWIDISIWNQLFLDQNPNP